MAAQQNGYAIVPHGSYDEWRNYALNHGVNVDYSYGNQCWDICALLWYQYGLNLATGPHYSAYECWTVSRAHNARGPFVAISNVAEIKRGDCLVFNRSGRSRTGHICFADESYHGSTITILGQNQGQGIGAGTPSIVIAMNLGTFIGAFRNTNWSSSPGPTPPTPPTPPGPGPQPGPTPDLIKDVNFPWVLYSRKLRNMV